MPHYLGVSWDMLKWWPEGSENETIDSRARVVKDTVVNYKIIHPTSVRYTLKPLACF